MRTSVKNSAKVVETMASKADTFKLYLANRSASKINGCPIVNDWHKQGLTKSECTKLTAEYNSISGYVKKPKSPKKAKNKFNPKKTAIKDMAEAGMSPDMLKQFQAFQIFMQLQQQEV